MSAAKRHDEERLAMIVPRAWRRFLRSGQYTGARASVRAGGSEVPVDLVARLEFVDDGRVAIDLALAQGPSPASAPERSVVHLLTARERAVITLIATGNETQEIAEALHISSSTVRTHVRNAMSKLGAHTRAQLVAVAMAGSQPVQAGHADDGAADESAR
jgi:DNA-binding NarL/FixJ family response regulator